MKRSFQKFETRLANVGLRAAIEKRALSRHVSLRELYDGPDKASSVASARRSVYLWLMSEGKSINEVARLFDRAPSGVWKLVAERAE